jgi:NAD(P)-dependent dehydrogenase (short-subunit alcohol dehydrogenase family)
VALVTGSSTGIGEAIARRFADENASVLVHGTNRDAAEAVAGSIRQAGGHALAFTADLSLPESAELVVQRTVAEFGRLDIVVNNAAWVVRSNIETTDVSVFDRAMAINVRAPMLIIKAARPFFLAVGGGTVLNIGSINAYCGEANQLAYAVSKGALMTLTRNLADTLGPEGIRINQINPGWVLTPNEYALKQREGLPSDWPEKLPKSAAPFGRIQKPEEIAHMALAFVSPNAPLVNGAVVELEQFPVIGRNPVKEEL